MRAAVLHGVDDLRIEEVPEPTVREGYVLIDVAYNGICGSDLGMIHAFGIATDPHPLTGACGPQILGHEFSGVVRQVGPGVEGVAVGDRVAVQPNYFCGDCAKCRDGHEHLCEKGAFHGINAPGGGLSERTAVPAVNVHPLPDTVSLMQAAVVEPLAVALHAVELSGATPGGFALVLGAGPIGIATGLNLRAGGIDRILLSEPAAARRRAAAELGFDVVDPGRLDPLEAVRARTDGAGADVVFECAGVGSAVQEALGAVRAHGTVVLLATYKEQVPLNTYALMFGEMRLMSALGYSRGQFRTVIERMACGVYPTQGWVECVPLQDLLVEGVQAAAESRRLKVLVEMSHG